MVSKSIASCIHLTLASLTCLLSACGSDETPPENDIASDATAQPEFDILLGDLSRDTLGASISSLRLIADHDGYENQPHFTADGSALLYTGIREDGQADIYRYDLFQKTTTPVTVTSESEYSATTLPNGRGFSVVRVETDSTQRLWAFDMDGSNPRLLIEDVAPVGYHAWGGDHTVALFVLGDPNTLQIADIESGTVETVETNVGRSLHSIPGHRAISFVHKESPDNWLIKSLDLEANTIETLTTTRPGAEDYAWTPAGTILMAEGAVLHEWTRETGWKDVADLSVGGINEVSRIAINDAGTLIAVVIR
jgi:hypothetical protein